MSKTKNTQAALGPSAIEFDLLPNAFGTFEVANSIAYEESSCEYDEDSFQQYIEVIIARRKYRYVPWGADNLLPYTIMHQIHKSSVMSMNKFFNVMTCYGQGLQYLDVETGKPSMEAGVRDFVFRNNIARFFMEQITDLKHFFFSVAVIILDRQQNPMIAQVVHKEACYCRFTKANDKGLSEYVLYGNFRNGQAPDHIEAIPILSDYDPIGDMKDRLRKKPDERKFAIVTKYPTVGHQYYPIPYYTAIFRDGWYDISQLITIGKKAKLRNKACIPYLVEIHKEYWKDRWKNNNCHTKEEQEAEVKKVKTEIEKFLTGVENSGKLWTTGFFSTPDGKEVHYVKITKIDTTKEGGDFSGDIAESNNIMCYADGLHPNLVGATPGSAQTNNSGSDKRELFTMKQAIEKTFHDLLARMHEVVIHWNGWHDRVRVDVPMIMLTTLDEKKDARKVTNNTNNEEQ